MLAICSLLTQLCRSVTLFAVLFRNGQLFFPTSHFLDNSLGHASSRTRLFQEKTQDDGDGHAIEQWLEACLVVL